MGKSLLADIASGEKTGISAIRAEDDDFQDAAGGQWGEDDDLFEDEEGAGAKKKPAGEEIGCCVLHDCLFV